jgi:ParB-like chromosome segregation protein Spo0J
MKVHCSHDRLVPIHELKQHPKNRNKHSKEQIERLTKILKYQGWRYPIKVSNRSGFITAGHGRLMAAIQAGETTVPVSFQDYDSDEMEYADVIADNEIARWAVLDLPKLHEDLKSFANKVDPELLGIKNFALDIPQSEFNPDDEEDEKKPRLCPHCDGEL